MRNCFTRSVMLALLFTLWLSLGVSFAQDGQTPDSTSRVNKPGDDATPVAPRPNEADAEAAGEKQVSGDQDDPTARLEWQIKAWGRANAEFRKNAAREGAKHNRKMGNRRHGAEVEPSGSGSQLPLATVNEAGSFSTSSAATGPAWISIGPTGADFEQNAQFSGLVRDSGRARTILPHPTDPNVVYILTSGGGLWKTSNWTSNDTAWTPLTDNIPTTGGGSVTFGRTPSTLYLGLGDPYDQIMVGGSVVKSTDGGQTWSSMIELGNAVSVRDIKVDTSTANDIVFVATDSGLFRSIDNGTSYNPVATFAGKAVWSIARTSAGWLASAQNCPAANVGLQCGQATSIYLSTDLGATWNAIVSAVFTANGRTTLGVGVPGDAVVYAYSSTQTDGAMRDVYRSADGGLTWAANGVNSTKAPTNPVTGNTNMNICHGQCWYNQMILVDPTDPTRNTVYIGGDLATARSTNGGGSWTLLTWWLYKQFPQLPYAHADNHAAAFKTTGTPTIIFGNDGGMNISTDNGVTFSSDKNNGLATHLYYTVTGNPNFPNLVLGGLQDNGTRLRTDNSTIHNQVIGGDGVGAAYSQANTNTVFGSSQSSGLRTNLSNNPPERYENWQSGTSGLTTSEAGFLTAIYPAPANLDPTGKLFFTFTNTRVYKTVNGGLNWTVIARVNTAPTVGLPAGRTFRSSPYNIGVSPTDLNRIALGAGGGFLDITTDGGATWVDLNLISLVPGYQGFVTNVSWQDNQNLWITSVAQATGAKRVVKASIASPGASWATATFSTPDTGLPDLPVSRVLFDPRDATRNTIYAATHVGIYRTTNGGGNWEPYGTGLPVVRVNDIYMPPDGGFIRIATYGRGVWEMPSMEFVGATLADDGTSCDNDGSLDKGETGHLTITLKNAGTNAVDTITATVTSTNPNITFPSGGNVVFPSAAGGAEVVGTVQVKVSNLLASVDAADFNIAVSVPDLPSPVNFTSTHRINYDLAASSTESFEVANNLWSTTSSLVRLPDVAPPKRRAISPTQTVFWVPDNNGLTSGSTGTIDEQAIVSPVMHVGAGPLSITISHRFVFESGGWDGGVLEVSTDGTTWTDADVTAYNGVTNAGGSSPLGANRKAFVNTSTGYPAFTTATFNLGTTYAGQDIKIRFRTGSDEFTGAAGWDIDQVSVSGITNTPFTALVPHAGVCLDSLSLASAPNPSTFNQPVTFTASLTGGVDDATGSITFKEGATVLGTAALSSNQASIIVSNLTVGSHSIFSEYVGDTTHQAATSNTIVQVVTYSTCLLFDNSRVANSGSTIPVKLQVCDVNGGNVSAAALKVRALRLVNASTAQVLPVDDPGSSFPGGYFVFSNGSYQYNLKTSKTTTPGTWNLIVKVDGDNLEHSISLQVR